MNDIAGRTEAADVAAAAERLAETDEWDAHGTLITALASTESPAALRPLLDLPAAVSRLDGRARPGWTAWPTPGPAVLDDAAARLSSGRFGPVGAALASMHRDGRVRAAAVHAMLADPVPEVLPFLVLRCCDWAEQVRGPARAGIAVLFAERAGDTLTAAAATVLAFRDRERGGFALAQFRLAVDRAPDDLLDVLAASRHSRVRRFAVQVRIGRSTVAELARIAETEPDRRLRVTAAEAACREAVWSNRIALLRRLATNPAGDVRALALTGLVRSGRDAEAAERLDDGSALVRALARAAARRLGIDVPAHHRTAIHSGNPSHGAIAGLAETGGPADRGLLLPLLEHQDAAIRASAVHGLRTLHDVAREPLLLPLLPLLRDPSATVVRAAVRALREPPVELLWDLLAEPVTARRRAAYHFLRQRDRATRLRAALIVIADRHHRLSHQAAADIGALLGRPWRQPQPVDVDDDERVGLVAMVDAAEPHLGARPAARLRALLGA